VSRQEGDSMARSVLVTGGNRGIGLATALAFAENGDRVAITLRSGQPPPALVRMKCLPLRCDVTSAEQVNCAFTQAEAAHGVVEVLVANAGITKDQLLLRMTEEDFIAVLNTNLVGAFRVVKRATAGMLEARKGRVILISSAAGLLGAAGQTNYAAAKAGLIGFARSFARELGPRGITCNIVAPGFVDTDMTKVLGEKYHAESLQRIPLGRYAAASEVAAAVRFLASAEAGYINGAVMPVDGGLGMGH
jgi:3-oxoacyl-[acyl-carrier protein] reductase